ncbi:ABC transporter ATP-binding protein [Anaerosalibacter sp. Marseille-P3206]|uniref:ABC transporter ATP-binding protein n=1 Tax=Anaerosalibacter sp. Marseille-P3206 TaxID=1871005 RepID=UPI0009870F32|nr:ABC transporter ATP-binding protein [Anaerosalibacter sp. Marseille-P3206]
MSSLVEIKDLSKSYFNKKALRNLNLNIEDGRVVGILGPNGSGKTTLIKILTGLLRQSSGEVRVDGKKIGVETKAIVSYLLDRNFLYKWMTIEDAFKFYGDFYSDFDEKRGEELLKFMKLERNMKINSLSKGMTEKLNLTLVLARKAKLYILDEPIAGVDPVARDKILDAIISNYNQDSSMIITTHLVRDMENVFDDVVFLREGEVILQGNAESLREEKCMSIDELYKEVFEE